MNRKKEDVVVVEDIEQLIGDDISAFASTLRLVS